jgi:hypothetical protein
MEKFDLELVSTAWEDKNYWNNIRQALTCGFFMQVAHKEGERGSYLTVKDNQVSQVIIYMPNFADDTGRPTPLVLWT